MLARPARACRWRAGSAGGLPEYGSAAARPNQCPMMRAQVVVERPALRVRPHRRQHQEPLLPAEGEADGEEPAHRFEGVFANERFGIGFGEILRQAAQGSEQGAAGIAEPRARERECDGGGEVEQPVLSVARPRRPTRKLRGRGGSGSGSGAWVAPALRAHRLASMRKMRIR